MRKLFLIILCVFYNYSVYVYAANVFVLDEGLHPSYYSSITDRVLKESCFSRPRDEKIIRYDTQTNSHYYEYKYASLCRNKVGELHGMGASLLRDFDLPGQSGGSVSDMDVTVSTSGHQSNIANVIKNNTPSSVKQWHAHHMSLQGSQNGTEWTNYRALSKVYRFSDSARALEYLRSSSIASQNKIKVVNLSWGDEERRHSVPCDNESTITNFTDYLDIRDAIEDLNRKDVVVVVATANTEGSQTLDNYKMPFPACLSSVVSVAAINHIGNIGGAVAPTTIFVETGLTKDVRNPPYETYGTSFAAPVVASQLAELKILSPNQSMRSLFDVLYRTSDRVCDTRQYNNGSTTISFCIQKPNMLRARSSVRDVFFSNPVALNLGNTETTKYGWNYGTNDHQNGILSYFQTPSSQAGVFIRSSDIDKQFKIAGSTSSVLRYSFNAYDIDTQDELEFLVNDKSYGFVTTTGSGILGSKETFCISRADLKMNGSNNEVKLRLKTSRETWGVTNLKIENGIFDSSCSNKDNTDPTNESVGLSIGTINPNQYGRNYGRDNNTDRLDVRFSTVDGLTHELSWQAYDIETGEMDVFLNDQKIKTVSATGSNQLGAVDNISMPSSSLFSGTNTVSFRVTGGDQKWGITNLLVDSILAEPGEPSSQVLVDDPATTRFPAINNAQNFTFDFIPRGVNYDETITLSFETFQELGHTGNGYKIYVNDIKRHTIPRVIYGQYPGGVREHQIVFDKSLFVNGSNTITITTSSHDPSENVETLYRNVLIVVDSIPILDVSVSDTSVTSKRPFTAIANVVNVGAKSSAANTVTFYVSKNSNKTNPTTLGGVSIPAMIGGASQTVTYPANSPSASNGSYIWACVGVESGDRNASNNCSAAVVIKKEVTLAPIYLLLE